jgi:hypothetical protein
VSASIGIWYLGVPEAISLAPESFSEKYVACRYAPLQSHIHRSWNITSRNELARFCEHPHHSYKTHI